MLRLRIVGQLLAAPGVRIWRVELTILIIGLGSAGDMLPNVGIGLALKRRGHRVVLIAGRYFEDLAYRTGLEFIGLGTEKEYYDAIQDPDLWHPLRSFSVVAKRIILPSMRPVYKNHPRKL